jgi:hypothetical protein
MLIVRILWSVGSCFSMAKQEMSLQFLFETFKAHKRSKHFFPILIIGTATNQCDEGGASVVQKSLVVC